MEIIRAVCRGEALADYTPARYVATAPDCQSSSVRAANAFNRFASEAADGVFLGGIPRARLAPTVEWARSIRPIAVSAYVSALFDESKVESVRPRMIYALLDAPEATRAALGVCLEDARQAARALGQGDPGRPAR